MSEPRLKSEIWVQAFIRRCWVADVPALLVRRGEETAGAVLIKANGFADGCIVFARGMTADGGWGWRRASGPDPLPEPDADAYVERQLRYDPDLWVVEVESLSLACFVDDPVEKNS
mgnify:CR=1 FL=1